MSFDISHLLDGWDYQPGQVIVRRFTGKDGEEKIQLRVDLGILQMNARGRPDGRRPHGHASLLDHFIARLDRHLEENDGEDDDFVLKSEDCSRLQIEALQFHHRCICLLQLEDFGAAVRDTNRNLKTLDFVDEYAESDDMAWSLNPFRPQVLLLRTRALAPQPIKRKAFAGAVERVKDGVKCIREFYEAVDREDLLEHSAEITALEDWLNDIIQQRPLSKREQLEHALSEAVKVEDYEKAAHVRDQLRKLDSEKSKGSGR